MSGIMSGKDASPTSVELLTTPGNQVLSGQWVPHLHVFTGSCHVTQRRKHPKNRDREGVQVTQAG